MSVLTLPRGDQTISSLWTRERKMECCKGNFSFVASIVRNLEVSWSCKVSG